MLRVQPLTMTQSINIAAKTNGTANGTGVDLAGVDAPGVLFAVGTWTDGTHALTVEESDVVGSGYTTVAAGDLVGTLTSLTAGGNSNVPQFVSYKGGKRFIRPVIVTSGATTGAVAGALVVNGHRQVADG